MNNLYISLLQDILPPSSTFSQNYLFTLCHLIHTGTFFHETKMDTLGKPDTACSYYTLCNTNGIALRPARTKPFAAGSGNLCLKGNRHADSGGADRSSFPAQFAGAWCGSHSATGYTLVFGEPECACAGMAVNQRKGGSGRGDVESCHFQFWRI